MTESISPDDIRRMLDSDRPVAVIDVRDPLEYSRGHITQSTPIPRRLLEFRISEVVPNTETSVILCDQRGERAESDADWLEALGYANVSYLDGGFDAWADAGFDTVEAQDGVYSTAFNFPSKDFGERVQIEERVEQIEPDELKALLDSEDESVVIADVRTPKEHREMTIPDALNVEGVDLGLYADQLREGNETLVVHCAGRTRSIIGAASLKKLGFENVYELENGTMGWELAGHELERGADRHVRKLDMDDASRDEVRSMAESLLEESGVSTISSDEFQALLADGGDEDLVVYPVDVRTEAEYEEGHIPGTLSIPGGQAIQTADEHFAVRKGTIVFVSNDHVRSAITAYWFSEMGFPNVTVLEGGLDSWRNAGRSIETGRDRTPPLNRTEIEDMVTYVSASELADSIDANDSGRLQIVDIDTSAHFERGHIPGAKWVPRYELKRWLDENHVDVDGDLVLTCRNGRFSAYAAAAVQRELGYENVRVLKRGTAAWTEYGRPLDTGTDGMEFEPRDALPPVTQQGDWAKQAYLEWEEELGDRYVSEHD